MIGDRLERDWTAPPYDGLAEAVVLRGLLLKPSSIADYDPSLLLVFPDHRLILAAMKRAHAADVEQSWGHFYLRWMDECERARPGHGAELVALLDDVSEDMSRWLWRDSARSRCQGLGMAESHHDFLWWWQRLKDIAEARRLVSQAQSMGASAWRGDVDAARQIAADVARRGPSPGIRIDIA